MKKRWLIFFMVFLLAAGIISGVYIDQNYLAPNMPPATPTNPTYKNCPYPFINPLRCEPDKTVSTKEYASLRNDLLTYIDQQKQNGSLTVASVYFRDLHNGPIMTINGEEDFAPASLLKVPLMITYLRKAQDDPNLLQRQITVAGDFSGLPQQNIKPQQSAVIGKKYSIDQLLTLVITQSDNNSWVALVTYLDKNNSENDFIGTLSDLGIIDPRINTNDQIITVEAYASIFRTLYNSSYLNAQMSDKALSLLTHSDFTNGIVAGVPSEIKVAHKFGERVVGDDQQLHDCGIVYYSPNPYIICVMTRGHDLGVLASIIQQISQDVYKEVQNRN